MEEEKIKKGIKEKLDELVAKLNRVSATDKMFFAKHLSVMVKAGISISKAVKTLAMQTKNKKFANILLSVHNDLDKGETFTNALGKYEDVFGELFINMIKSGEISGKLEDVLVQLYTQLKKSHDLVSKIRNALIYPVIVIVSMGGIGIAMLVFVVPKITNIFTEVDAELPLATKILINISSAINNHAVIVSIGVVVFIVGFVKILKTKKGKSIFDIIILKTPILSPIIKKINLALFSRTIGSLLNTDIAIVESFKITAGIMKNSQYSKRLLQISAEVEKGVSITDAINYHKEIFPPVVLQMVSVGEETGTLSDILNEVANFYEEEVSSIMETLPSIIEPVLMLVLGAAVAFMALSILMPMYSLTQHI